ncbi:MAG: OmpH family outer membrane protein [Deltaproteobacteria bacterium]|jgi:outer membrane protein|nr:OmpH family outer membrane protein [Deltaproteobacteria bacterium]
MSISKKLLSFSTFATLALALIFCLAGAAQAQNVGVVDLKKAVDDSKAGKAANNKLQSKYDSLKKNLEGREKELEKKQKDLQNQASTLNEDAFNKKREELAKDIQNFRDQAQKATDEMQKAMADAMSPIFQKAEKAAGVIAGQRGYALIIDAKESGAIFFASAIDITAEITKALDK